MSRILITACVVIFTTSALFAQQPTADSIATEPKQARWANVIEGDSLLALAGANGKLDYAVFGQVARNDEQYNALVTRFENLDGKFELSDIFVLYYGQAFRDDFAGGHISGVITPETSDFEAAYNECCQKLAKSPTSLRLLGEAGMLAHKLNLPEEVAKKYRIRYLLIREVITLTGDGTFDQPYKVVHISDEYEILFSLLGATSIVTQGVASGATIMDRITYTIKSATTDPVTNEQQLEQQDVYFDIELPMAYLQRMFLGGGKKR